MLPFPCLPFQIMRDVRRLDAAVLADQHIAKPTGADLAVQGIGADAQDLLNLAGADHHPSGRDLFQAF
jgi:hypothetical protein